MGPIEVGKLLRAGTSGFVAGCRLAQIDQPALGALVKAEVSAEETVYGLITDIRIQDDGLVRQLVTAERIQPEIIADNRRNRNVPVEITVITVGYRSGDRIFHLLPPRPPLSLDTITLCEDNDLFAFTDQRRFGYFRHLLASPEIPLSDVIASHFLSVDRVHRDAGDTSWMDDAARELVTLLRDDHTRLMSVLSSLAELYDEVNT